MSEPTQASASDLCHLGMSLMGRFHADAMQTIDAAIEADKDYCLPHIIKASMLQGANDARFNQAVADLIKRAQQLLPEHEGTEKGLLNAVIAAHAGNGVEAATQYEHLLNARPDDLFLNGLAREQTFWLGGSLLITARCYRCVHSLMKKLASLKRLSTLAVRQWR